MQWTYFDYLYRDAGNHKAFGCIAIEGHITKIGQNFIQNKFDGGIRFIAERLNTPVLYDQLYKWSGGPTADDHCWHEWERFRFVNETSPLLSSHIHGTVDEFMGQIEEVDIWDGELSPHFYIGSPTHMFFHSVTPKVSPTI